MIPRYDKHYRAAEIRHICDYARRGLSTCFVGIAGSGKSNIVNFLSKDEYGYRAQYLGEDNDRVLFPVVIGNRWKETALHLWEMMLAALRTAAPDLSAPAPLHLELLSPEEQRFAQLKAEVAFVCQQQKMQVMFILDDFDEILAKAPFDMLEALHELRYDQRERLSYLIFTKRLPHLLRQESPINGRSKFYDLFSNAIYALEPYSDTDTRQMLHHLNEQTNEALSEDELAAIQAQSGGHARLIYLLFHLWSEEHPPITVPLSYFLSHPQASAIRSECQRILDGLHPEEQAVAIRLAQGRETPADAPVVNHLLVRGLIKAGGWNEWSIPLLAEFLRNHAH